MTELAAPTEVAWLSGCNMSYRKELFDEFSFDERFEGNGWGDDRDFSYRVSRRYRLVATPDARLVHKEVPAGRIGALEFGRLEIRHFLLFFEKGSPKATPVVVWIFCVSSLIFHNSPFEMNLIQDILKIFR